MNQNKRVYAIFYKAEVACDVISSELLTLILTLLRGWHDDVDEPYDNRKQEAHHKVGLGETPRHLVRKTLSKFFTREIWSRLWRISHHFLVINLSLHFAPVWRTFL